MKKLISALVMLSVLIYAPAFAQEIAVQQGEILVRGIISAVNVENGRMQVRVTSIRMPGETADTLLQDPTAKPVTWTSGTILQRRAGQPIEPSQLVTGAEVVAVGRNLGRGAELPARMIVLYLPGDAPPPSQSDPSAVSDVPDDPLAGIESVPVVSANWNMWQDPAGFQYAYPSDWTPLAAVGANPITFQKGPFVMQVRRLPVAEGSTPQARLQQAIAAVKATAGRKNWATSDNTLQVATHPSSIVTLRGNFTPADFADLLGANPRLMDEIGSGIAHLIFVPIPVSAGRETFALEIGLAGPQQNAPEISRVLNRVVQSFTLGRQEVREAPGQITPMRTVNVVQIQNVLRQAGTAMQMYFVDNDDIVPANWQALAPYLGGESGLVKNLREGWPNWNVGPVQLLQPGQRVSALGNPANTPVARADGPGFSVILFADGHVQRENR